MTRAERILETYHNYRGPASVPGTGGRDIDHPQTRDLKAKVKELNRTSPIRSEPKAQKRPKRSTYSYVPKPQRP